MHTLKILLISANRLPASPAGPAYVAGAALQAGHTVEVFDLFLSDNVEPDLAAHLDRFQPDVIAISIRIVNGYVTRRAGEQVQTSPFDARPPVRELVAVVRRYSPAPVVLGGPGFNYYSEAWLNYLDLDYGIRGEAEFAFPLYLDRLEKGGDICTVPGAVFRQQGGFGKVPRQRIDNLDDTGLPAYELFDLDSYKAHDISPAIFTKRGCAFNCTFCPYSSLEGTRQRMKSPRRVVDEMAHIQQAAHPARIAICENSFNVPRRHAEAICHEIMARKLDVAWGTDSLKPLRLTGDFLRLMRDSGCNYLGLSLETASPDMLRRMNRHYRVDDARVALECLSQSDIPWGLSLMFGCPGESPTTIAETLALVDEFPTPPVGVWVSVGICLWTHHQAVLADARRDGQLAGDTQLFEGTHYISPELPKDYMVNLVASLEARPGYTVQVNKLHSGQN